MAVPESVVAPKAVRDDGSVPFVAPVAGVAPTAPEHLVTKSYADGLSGGGGPHQPLDAELTALAALASAADKLPFFNGVGSASLADLTAWVRANILPAADAAAVRTALGLGALALLAQVNLASQVTGTLPVANGGTGGTNATAARANLSAAASSHTHPALDISINEDAFSGSLSGESITDVQALANWIDANVTP